MGRRVEGFCELRFRVGDFCAQQIGFDIFAWEGEGDEDSFAFVPGEACTAVDGFFDMQPHAWLM
jgi:hypothetical protein